MALRAVVHAVSEQMHFSSARRARDSMSERKPSHAEVSYGGLAKRPTPEPQASAAAEASDVHDCAALAPAVATVFVCGCFLYQFQANHATVMTIAQMISVLTAS